ncbi:MAG: NAD-dependent epimerase/dehydratase family protein [Alphaproteobacteria bacterium]|nr:NAD-dependent epimerase/dehydratase family protein [Alphaproteobacteria bacterium]
MRILITGGCGYIGAAVTRAAVDRGHRVLNIDRRRKSAQTPALASVNGRPGYARIEADIADRVLMRALFNEFQPDRVIHLAAALKDDPDSLFDTDIAGAYSILEACRRHVDKLDDAGRAAFRLVHARRAPADAGDDTAPTHRDAVSATAATLLDKFARAAGLPLITCTAHEVFGPWQTESGFLPGLVLALLSGRPFALEAAGCRVRDWLPVADFASGILCAAEVGGAFEAYDFSTGAERRDLDIAESVAAIIDGRQPRGAGPWSELIDLSGIPDDAPPAPMFDSSPAEIELGWRPAGFHAGLDRALNWLLQSAPQPAQPLAAE